LRIEDFSVVDLIKLIQLYAKNWLAHDGCWFLAVEQKFGLQTAIELDAQSWACFSPVEARRIMQTFDIPEGGGLDALEKALGYRLYATVNRQESERVDMSTLRFRMVECRVQQARQRKGLPPFPCKSVGLVEYSQFAQTVDPRIETVCVHAPPDAVTDSFCKWEFRIRPHDERIQELERQIQDLKERWPAHSVPPAMLERLDELEGEFERLKR
jgi:uncharacterized protein DUF6125